MKTIVTIGSLLIILLSSSVRSSECDLVYSLENSAREKFLNHQYLPAIIYSGIALMGDRCLNEQQKTNMIKVQAFSYAETGDVENPFRLINQHMIKENSPQAKSNLLAIRDFITKDIHDGNPYKKEFSAYFTLINLDEWKNIDIEDMNLSKETKKKIEEVKIDSQKTNYKNPLLAAIMSGILPGSGQIYNGTYQSAAMAFLFNAALALTTIEFIKHDLAFPAITSGLIFSITYTGNIINAGKTARDINKNLNIERNEKLKNILIPSFIYSF